MMMRGQIGDKWDDEEGQIGDGWEWWNGANCEAGDFHANLAFSFLDNTQRSITIYTRARVSLLSLCALEHWPSIIAEKPAVETQFLRRL